MPQDWKDMLASLAGNTADAGGDAPASESVTDEDTSSTTYQKTSHPALHILIDRKGRKGKTATIIEGFTLDDDEVDAIASELKRKIGTGGSARGGEILLQGDWREKAAAILRDKGFKVK